MALERVVVGRTGMRWSQSAAPAPLPEPDKLIKLRATAAGWVVVMVQEVRNAG